MHEDWLSRELRWRTTVNTHAGPLNNSKEADVTLRFKGAQLPKVAKPAKGDSVNHCFEPYQRIPGRRLVKYVRV